MISLLKKSSFKYELSTLDKVFYIMVFLFLFSLPLSEALKQFSMYSMFLLFAYSYISKDVKISYDFINIVLLLHLVIVICGISFGINSEESLSQWSGVLRISLVFIIFRNIDFSKMNANFLISILLLTFIITIIWGLFNFFDGERFIKLKSVGSANRSAVYISLMFILSMSLLYFKSKINSYLIYISLVLSFLGILFGGSRMAVYTLPILIFILLFLNKKLTIRNVVYMVVPGIIVLGVTLFIFKDSYFAKKMLVGFSDIHRVQLWLSTIYIWSEHNLFFGIGVGNSIFFSPKEYFPESIMDYIDNAHNTFLDMLLERGLLGLLTYLAFIFSILSRLISLKKESKVLNGYFNIGILFFATTFIMSFANITFRYEFALLTVVIWGILLNKSFTQENVGLS